MANSSKRIVYGHFQQDISSMAWLDFLCEQTTWAAPISGSLTPVTWAWTVRMTLTLFPSMGATLRGPGAYVWQCLIVFLETVASIMMTMVCHTLLMVDTLTLWNRKLYFNLKFTRWISFLIITLIVLLMIHQLQELYQLSALLFVLQNN